MLETSREERVIGGKDALMVIDVDHSSGWSPDRVKYGEEQQIVKAAIEEELENWRSRQGLIVHVILPTGEDRYKFSGQEMQIRSSKAGCLICSTGEDSRIAEFVNHRCDSEPAFVKRNSDAFENRNIPDFLRSQGVSTVFLAGCYTTGCVAATAMGALWAGFDVVLLADATFYILKKEEEDGWIELVMSGFKPEYKAREKVRVMRAA